MLPESLKQVFEEAAALTGPTIDPVLAQRRCLARVSLPSARRLNSEPPNSSRGGPMRHLMGGSLADQLDHDQRTDASPYCTEWDRAGLGSAITLTASDMHWKRTARHLILPRSNQAYTSPGDYSDTGRVKDADLVNRFTVCSSWPNRELVR